jgi:hypothetical protein
MLLVRLIAALGLTLLALPAYGQTKTTFECGAIRTESWRAGNTTHWTIARAKEKNTESATLRKGPRFECIGGGALAVEFTPVNGSPFIDLYFPDGANIAYGGQHFERNGRFVLPIQARPRIPAAFRAAFDYHCRFELPMDPIPADARKDCVP